MARHEVSVDHFRAQPVADSVTAQAGFPSAFALNGSAWARINMLDRFDLSDEKLRDALDSSP